MPSLPKINSTVGSLIVAAFAAGAVALTVEHWRSTQNAKRLAETAQPLMSKPAQASGAASSSREQPRSGTWIASAPGRIEPRDGEVRIGAQLPGKVAQVLVRMNDTVKAGDLLVRLADEDAMAKLEGAMTEASVRRRERDGEQAVKLVAERRAAEDALSFAERAAFRARSELDRLQMTAANGVTLAEKEIEQSRTVLAEATDKLEQERARLRRVQAQAGMPLPTRLEASLAVARAELGVIEATIEKMRIRAPADGTVMLVNTRAGETASPSPEDVLLVFGDLSLMRVRAEIEERDVGKIRAGQTVVVRSDAFPGQDFNGTVQRVASALGAPRIAPKGPRRQTDQDVMQVLINLDGRPPFVSGLRVDVFFRPDATVGTTPAGAPRAN